MNNDWFVVLYAVTCVLTYVLHGLQEKRHRKEIDRIHESYKEERQELLDRIMANNIHEFKSVNGAPTKRSETGNYLKDRMVKETMKQFDME
jgi:thiosulfate reductase cytochrome b subunit